jgi:hypothetical protein
MRKLLLLLVLLSLFYAPRASAQATNLSGTVTDTASQTWNNGTYNFQFVPGNNATPSVWTGGPLTLAFNGALDASGNYSLSIPSNNAITPVGSYWRLTVCSATVGPVCSTINVTTTGGSQTANVTPAPPVIPPGANQTVYNTNEVGQANVGAQIYVIGAGFKTCSTVVNNLCTVWVSSSGSNISLNINGSPSSSQSNLNITGTGNVVVTDTGGGTASIGLTGLVPAPNTTAAIAGQALQGYNQSTGNFNQGRYGIAAPIFSTTDTLTDTVTTEQFFATNMAIPAASCGANTAYKFFVELEWTGVATVPNFTFQIYLGTTAGTATGAKQIYKSTTTAPATSTFNSGMEFAFVCEAAVGSSVAVTMMPAGGTGANSPIGRNVLAAHQTGLNTSGNLFVFFSITYSSAAGAGANTTSVRALISEPGPII